MKLKETELSTIQDIADKVKHQPLHTIILTNAKNKSNSFDVFDTVGSQHDLIQMRIQNIFKEMSANATDVLRRFTSWQANDAQDNPTTFYQFEFIDPVLLNIYFNRVKEALPYCRISKC